MSKKKKSENRKALPKFLGIVFLATLGGGIAGGCIGFFGGMMTPDHIVESIHNIVETIAPYGVWIITLLFTALELRLYLKARALYQSWDGEDEEILETAEEKLSWVLMFSSTNSVINFSSLE